MFSNVVTNDSATSLETSFRTFWRVLGRFTLDWISSASVPFFDRSEMYQLRDGPPRPEIALSNSVRICTTFVVAIEYVGSAMLFGSPLISNRSLDMRRPLCYHRFGRK